MTKTYTRGRTVEENVLLLLREFPETRSDDMVLFSRYYNTFTYFPAAEEPLEDLAYDYKDYGFPCFETIRRARQRVQSCFPELRRTDEDMDSEGVRIYIRLV